MEGRGRTVLLVDDDPAVRHATAMVLRDEGYVVAEACHGGQALSWLRAHPRDAGVVLLDLMMPVMDGRDFLEAKDAEPAIAGIPVVLVTASSAQGERLRHVVREVNQLRHAFERIAEHGRRCKTHRFHWLPCQHGRSRTR
jgi:CheY-like chemotaxis protein